MSLKSKVLSLKFLVSVLATFGVMVSVAFGQSDGAQQNRTGKAGTFAIVGARIVTVSGAVIENGTVVIQNGKITAVGAGAAIPSGAERIDGKGLSVFPGMIDASTNMGLVEIGQGANATVDVQEVGNYNANAKAIDGINPHTSHINVTRVDGVLTVSSEPSGGIVSGQTAVINLNGSTQMEMAVVPTAALLVNFPRVTGGGGFGGFGGGGGGQQADFNELIRRRDTAVEDLKKMFREVERYAKMTEAYARDKSLPMPATNRGMDAMIPYVRGQKPIHFTAERERDIRAVAKFVAEMKVKGVIVGGQDAWKAADDLKKNNISVIYTNVFSLPVQQDDAYDYLFEAPSLMLKAGVKFAISTGEGGGNVRELPIQAGLAGGYGLGKDEALKSVTLYPAQILGIDDKLGSIEVGKMANLVVTDGDMLDSRTNIKHIFIAGRKIPMTSRHTDLFDSFKDRK